ncbi:MAG: YlxR family protein [Chloroflexi bacterium]|nr:YlxR family protein [Chloroflexota bacterium]
MPQPLRPKHVPLRSCVACRTKGPKSEFVRLVRTPSGEVALDPPRNVPGRGAYVCRRLACWEIALEKGRLSHTLRGPVPPEARATLLKQAREKYEIQS